MDMDVGLEQNSDFDLLGDQLAIALQYAEHGFGGDEVFHCAVTHDDVAARDLFHAEKNRFFLRYDSLPGTLSVKAIAVDSRALFIETGRVDVIALREACERFERLEIGGLGVRKGNKQLAVFREPTREHCEKGYEFRTLWVIPWRRLDAEHRELALKIADAAYTYDTFLAPEDTSSVDATGVAAAQNPGVRLEQRMDLQLNLIQEQVPVLALELGVGMEMQQQVQMALAMEQRLRRMSEEEIVEELAKDPSTAGQQRLLNNIIFALARDVKKAAKELGRDVTWREARDIARKATRRRTSLPPDQPRA